MRWFIVPDGGTAAVQRSYAQVLAVHAALLHTGQILMFSGDEHDPGQHIHGLFDHTRLFDTTSFAVTGGHGSPSTDAFCCGQAFLPDGRLLIGGGTEGWTAEDPEGEPDPAGHVGMGHFRGHGACWWFDPASQRWTATGTMIPEPGRSIGGGRWYPTLLTLADGTVVAMTGHPTLADSRHNNDSVEVFDPSTGSWSLRGRLPGDLTFYPRLHLLPDGTVFSASPINGQSWRWNPGAPTSSAWTPVCPAAGSTWVGGPEPENFYGGFDTTSVLLPLRHSEGYRARVLMANKRDAMLVDLGQPVPTWQPMTRTLGGAPRRYHANAVLLPTGDVALCGGMANPGDDPGSAVHDVEIFVSSTLTWVTLPPAGRTRVARNYHSVALLLPDGRVWTAGSNIRSDWSYHNSGSYPAGTLPTTAVDAGVDNRELRIEIFEPWYFGRPDRPTAALASGDVHAGGTLTITSPRSDTISRVMLLRQGSATHSYNSDQRAVDVRFSRGKGTIHAALPRDGGVLPPGYYLVFVLDQVVDPATGAVLEVPSTGHFVRVSPALKEKFENKYEIKENWKAELKENLKNELKEDWKLEVEVLQKKDEVYPKVKDNELPDDIVRLDVLPWVRDLLARVEKIEGVVGRGQPFIRRDLRPEPPAFGAPDVAHRFDLAAGDPQPAVPFDQAAERPPVGPEEKAGRKPGGEKKGRRPRRES